LVTRYSDGEKIRNLIHRTQDIGKSYFINSSIYAFKTENLFSSEPSLWGDKVLGYIMDSKYAMDIDSPEDWIIAEAKMKKVLKESK
jgi:CMP-N-acetylneuraminic acid synthetase